MLKDMIFLTLSCFLGFTVFAVDPGGAQGFVKAVFISSTGDLDIKSSIWENAKSRTLVPQEVYAAELPERTTVAFGSYMKMEEGVTYQFKCDYNDRVAVRVGSTWVLPVNLVGRPEPCTGSYTPKKTDWYQIELRVGNLGWPEGVYPSTQYRILWKESSQAAWRKFTSPSLFKTGKAYENLQAEPMQVLAEVISAKMRPSDPVVMEVEYKVYSEHDTVNVRALAFENGVRSFANVVRPSTFLEGSVIGDNVPANTVNSFAWKVSADWKVDLAQVAVEVLAKEVDEGLVPLDLVTIPAHGNYGAVTCSTNVVSDAEYRDALYWLYADGDVDLSLKDGWLRDAQGRFLIGDNSLSSSGYVAEFVYSRMGYDAMGTNCQWPHAVVGALERMRRVAMPYWGCRRYAVKGWTAPAAQTMGNGLYMVIDLNITDYGFPVSYLDAAPAKWGDEYKTNKIVLRRIDDPNGTYYAGIFEVTEAQWAKVMGGTSTSTKPENDRLYNDIRGDADVYDWPSSNEVDVNSFMGALRLMTGIPTFDLPSETEWEYAARAGVTTKWLCGDSEMGLDDYAWYSANSSGPRHEVGTRAANAWGLYDVHGNVWEWCLNRYSGDSRRVLRGGSSHDGASYCAFDERYLSPYSGWDYGGFRLFCRPGSN